LCDELGIPQPFRAVNPGLKNSDEADTLTVLKGQSIEAKEDAAWLTGIMEKF
jgi:hypothetical protein